MNYVKLYDRQGNFTGDASPDTRCWCTHTLGVHYSSHCVDGCPCGGSYPPRLPEGKRGFSQAMPKPAVCISCGAKAPLPTHSKQHPICDYCRSQLQATVDRAVQAVESEIVNGSLGSNRPWYKPGATEIAYFVLGALTMAIVHLLGWWP